MQIFVLGAVTGTTEKDLEKFKIYIDTLKKIFPSDTLVSPDTIWEYRNTFEKNHKDITLTKLNKAMVDYDLDMIRKSDIYICDLSNISTGMGIELGTILTRTNYKIYFLAKSNSVISNMILGAFSDVDINYYNDVIEIEDILKSILK